MISLFSIRQLFSIFISIILYRQLFTKKCVRERENMRVEDDHIYKKKNESEMYKLQRTQYNKSLTCIETKQKWN